MTSSSVTRRKVRRGAFNLIELGVIVGTTTIVLSLGGVLFGLLFKLDRSGRAALDDLASVTRLARELRADVRGAEDATTAESGLDLAFGDGRVVRYRPDASGLLRSEARGDSKTARRERFTLKHLGPARFRVEGGVVGLELPRTAAVSVRPAFLVEAVVGLDRGVERPSKGDHP